MSHGAEMCYLIAQTKGGYKARFFAPRDRIAEDPATGSAAAALAAVRRFIGEGSGAAVIHQGDEVGAPSTIRLKWDERHASFGGTVRRDEVRSGGDRDQTPSAAAQSPDCDRYRHPGDTGEKQQVGSPGSRQDRIAGHDHHGLNVLVNSRARSAAPGP
jgi:hypothetical protein